MKTDVMENPDTHTLLKPALLKVTRGTNGISVERMNEPTSKVAHWYGIEQIDQRNYDMLLGQILTNVHVLPKNGVGLVRENDFNEIYVGINYNTYVEKKITPEERVQRLTEFLKELFASTLK